MTHQLMSLLSDLWSSVTIITYMWNLKKGHNELLCRKDTDSQTLKNLWSPKETVWGVGECAGVVGWKSYKIEL